MNRFAIELCVVFVISSAAIAAPSASAGEPHVGRWKLVITDSKGQSMSATAIVRRSEGTIVTSDKRHGKLTDFRFVPPSAIHPHGSMLGSWHLDRLSGSFSVQSKANRNQFKGTVSANTLAVAYASNGDFEKETAIQEKAIAKAPAGQQDAQREFVEAFRNKRILPR